MKIRKATERDAPAIAALLHTLPDLRSIVSELPATTAKKIETNLRLATASSTSTILVAETDAAAIAGYCAVHWVPFLFFAGGEGYVSEVFVRASDSGNGIGTRLLDTVIAEARQRGCTRLSLLNGRNGESYRRNFYAQRGWIEREPMANFVFPLTHSAPAASSKPAQSKTPVSPG